MRAVFQRVSSARVEVRAHAAAMPADSSPLPSASASAYLPFQHLTVVSSSSPSPRPVSPALPLPTASANLRRPSVRATPSPFPCAACGARAGGGARGGGDRRGAVRAGGGDGGGRRAGLRLHVSQRGYEVLLVSQFTLYGQPKGNKLDFHVAMPPQEASAFYDSFVHRVRRAYHADRVKDGIFGAMMEVHIANSGPVTLFLDSRKQSGTDGNGANAGNAGNGSNGSDEGKEGQ
ncbi:unnamed protein product [Closterium sp. Yama58-4]|nr:unnamed protein product [Closterium sp. Yama58-4]